MESNEPIQEKEAEMDDHDFEHGHGRCCGRRRFWKIPFIVAAIILVKSAVIMFLWNELVPDLFHGPIITYLQAIEIAVLAKLLVGFHGHGFGRHRHGHGRGHHWRRRWEKLSPEQREKLRETFRNRCRH